MHDGSLKFVPLIFKLSRTFWDKIKHDDSVKFVPLLFAHLGYFRIFSAKIMHDGSFRFVPLLYTRSRTFSDFQSDDSVKYVPLLFPLSMIFWDKNMHHDSFRLIMFDVYPLDFFVKHWLLFW